MFSRFFIDRPVFATVIAIVIVLAGGVTLLSLPITQYPEIARRPPCRSRPPILAPMPELSRRLSHNRSRSRSTVSRACCTCPVTCSNDGSYRLTVSFEVGADLDMAAVLVQNRVAVAEPMLPEEVKRLGVTTKKQSTNIILFLCLTASDDRYDDRYLSNYATLRVKDELARLDGVGDVMIFGAGDYSLRVWLDPEKLKARNLTTTDVVAAIREQNVQVAAGQSRPAPGPAGTGFPIHS